MFDMILNAKIEINTYQSKDGTWGYIYKVDGRVKGGDIGYPTKEAAYRAGNAR